MLRVKKGGLKAIAEEPEHILAPSPSASLMEEMPKLEAAQENWQMLLAKALVSMPPETLSKVVGCIPSDVLVEVIKAREDDPVVKLALVLLNAQRQA
ncbi:hypothetical protein Pogu_0738 [Pyrobaculum oguniense TE7]|uniref:Uncharacterized protein n=1 Tax=Pyrobaculum oguniense (strain DSM 13380 / JCM 10595 / TE7) TaxID=698757 RepID=H6Q835_PYROT|nr:hypothetical protein Pogu_0738 [Pyrobaculum oguniense TE7]